MVCRFIFLCFMIFINVVAQHANQAFSTTGINHSPPTFRQRFSVANSMMRKKPWYTPYDNDASIDELEDTCSDEYIDKTIDSILGSKGGDIIRKWKPQRFWLLRRWRRTILVDTLWEVIINMVATGIIAILIKRYTGGTWKIGFKPDVNHPFVQRLSVFNTVWHYQQSLTTFILTFFLNQAYSFWRDMYLTTRKIQGRMNDISLMLATSVRRDEQTGELLPESKEFLEDVGSNLRSFHVLCWSNYARRFRVLLTPRGLYRLVQKNILSQNELDTLLKLNLPPNQRHNACLEWVVIRYHKALLRTGATTSGNESQERKQLPVLVTKGLDHTFFDKVCTLRGLYAGISDKLDGRMPLAYTHFVQWLVDVFIFWSPFALYVECGIFAIFGVGLLTLFYSGLLKLSKVFLDPLDNEDFSDGSTNMDLSVLIRESNSGSTRFKDGVEYLPF